MTATPDPDRIRDLVGGRIGKVQIVSETIQGTEAYHGATLEKLTLTTSEQTEIPALRIRTAKDQSPTILYCHAHGANYAIGCDELINGRPALTGPYGPDLAKAGFNVLCIEMPTFGARAKPKEPALAKTHLWHGTTLFGEMLAELSAAVTYLAKDPTIDATRIATLGISMGGTHAWWLAALDQRIAAAVSLCCFADLATLIETGAHDGHGIYMTVPGLLAETSTGALAGLTAPRPQLIAAGMQDWSTPPAAFAKARQDLEAAYQRAKASTALNWVIDQDTGHEETPEMRKRVLEFLADQLIHST